MTTPPNNLELPPQVLQALETLERATSPTELGEPHLILLTWKKKNLRWRPSGELLGYIILGFIFAGLLLLQRQFELHISDFWRGALFGALVMNLIISAERWFTRPPPPPLSLRERAYMAIDRWRSAVPAMRDFPK